MPAPEAAADSQNHPAIAQIVENRNLLGDAQRIVPRQHDHHRAEPDAPGPSRHVGQELNRIGDHLVVGEVMFGRPHGIEAQLLGQIAKLDLFLPDIAVRTRAVRVLERRGVADLHCVLPNGPCCLDDETAPDVLQCPDGPLAASGHLNHGCDSCRRSPSRSLQARSLAGYVDQLLKL